MQEVLSAFAWGIGVDVSREMIRIATLKHLPNVRFLEGDCFELARFCPSAGAVLSRGVLLSHYGPAHAESLLRAFAVALAPGGFCLFDFLSEEGRATAVHAPETKTYFKRSDIHALCLQAGFARVRVMGGKARRVLIGIAEVA
jgi:SAM-dependent methyltransferase